ncbi:MAG: winged helix DNA-binding domain-containing protein, partial [Acidimicrobiales bacterium]
MREIGVAERRARLGRRHGLADEARFTGAVDAATALWGLHATDPVSIYLSLRARIDGFRPEHLETAMYDEHRVVRMLGMRRTVFVIPVDRAAVMHQACSAKVAATHRRALVKLLEENGNDQADGWLADLERRVVETLTTLGAATAVELSAAVPDLRTSVSVSLDKPYGGTGAINNRVLTQLAADGQIVRGRPTGRWTSTRYRWEPVGHWIDQPLDSVDPTDAEATMAGEWLRTYGPATEADLRWWAGWTLTQTRRALATIGAIEVGLDGAAGWAMPDDLDPVIDPQPWVALLPALDPTAMGWKDRDWYLGPHRDALFDRSGNIGPTIWSDGRVVGGWAQRPDGSIAWRLLED